MSVIYLLALVGVGLAITALTLDSVLSVSRKPRWAEGITQPSLHIVPVVERREQALPFVGVDRRRSAPEVEELRTSRVA